MALSANELRIGNYLIDPFYGTIVEVNISILESIHNGTEYKPIPLTEEILLKCGFEKYGIWFKIKDFHVSIGHNIAFEKWVTSYRTPEYLHQLQNLYFALKQEELIYDVKY